jgi:hypothetical protein
MIALEEQKIILMTPNKCASSTLHEVFCHSPWNGLYVIGPQGPWKSCGFNAINVIGKHTTELCWEHKEWKKYIVIRDPFDRFISLWKHYCKYHDVDVTLEQFVDLVVSWQGPEYYKMWFYTWTIRDYLFNAPENVITIKQEILQNELEKIGLKTELPKLHSSEREPWQTYYTPHLYNIVSQLV